MKTSLRIREIPFSSVSPFQIYEAQSDVPSAFLLGGDHTNLSSRYSYVSLGPPKTLIALHHGRVKIQDEGGNTQTLDAVDPLDVIRAYTQASASPKHKEGLPPFLGGAVGYISYDAGRLFDRVRMNLKSTLGLPDMAFGLYDDLLAFDHRDKRAWLIGQRCLPKVVERDIVSPAPQNSLDWVVSHDESAFVHMVRQAQNFIRWGEIYQANLSLRISSSWNRSALLYYQRLQEINPSPYACVLRMSSPDFCFVSSSPELLIRKRGRHIETRPIAGTRPRGQTAQDDRKLSEDLLLSEKERAEHVMLVDLERNDLGRVCEPGTVRVSESFVIERYSHVMHIVSNLEGELEIGKEWPEALRAVFPGGTVSGCPKIRAMEIIDQLEPVSRGPFFGSVGWIGYDGDMDMNILIRTALVTDGKIHMQVGAGIVADSDPVSEYRESLQKAKALIIAVQRPKSKVQSLETGKNELHFAGVSR